MIIQAEKVLGKAGKNRVELEKAIKHFSKAEDSLKLKATYFLIANMDLHFSDSYYWADKLGNEVVFDELSYDDFEASVKAFELLKEKYPGIHPVPKKYPDMEIIKGDFLIENVEKAFQSWNNNNLSPLNFQNFCEFILPYRIVEEPLQNWRGIYQKKYSWLPDKNNYTSLDTILKLTSRDYKTWFVNTWRVEKRTEPLPRLGALQLLHRKKGACEDIADLEVFILRSQGIPATIDFIPYWATSFGSHFFNCAFDSNMNPLPFDIMKNNEDHIIGNKENFLAREPGKVIRVAYSRQPGSLSSIEDAENIPKGFMRNSNIQDVTSQYWETTRLKVPLFKRNTVSKVAYLSVYNNGSWKPIWWGPVKGDSATFENMPKGAVFLPFYYHKGQKQIAGYPIALGYQNQKILQPDLAKVRTISISWQENYLIFRPGKKYRLFYWDKSWVPSGEQTANENTEALVFEGVPRNVLFLLVPEYSEKKERPFIITDDGKRLWL